MNVSRGRVTWPYNAKVVDVRQALKSPGLNEVLRHRAEVVEGEGGLIVRDDQWSDGAAHGTRRTSVQRAGGGEYPTVPATRLSSSVQRIRCAHGRERCDAVWRRRP